MDAIAVDNTGSFVYFPLVSIFAILLVSTFKSYKDSRKQLRCSIFLAIITFWLFLHFVESALLNTPVGTYFTVIADFPLPFLPVALFYYAVWFYRTELPYFRFTYEALLVLPVANALLSIASGRIFEFARTIINIYALLVCLLSLYVIIEGIRRLPRAYRHGSVFHLIALGFVFVSVLVYGFVNPGYITININYIGVCLAGIFFYFAHIAGESGTGHSFDKRSIVDFLEPSIFILNEDGNVVENNRAAISWLSSLGRKIENVSFDGLLSLLQNNKRIEVKTVDETGEKQVHFINVAVPQVFKLDRTPFILRDGVTKGELVVLEDISKSQLLVDRLREIAGIDGLTQTANRYRYQELLLKLDKREHYPLAVVIGDVNNLKTVNDTFGHQEGDKYLKDIADVLVKHCPKKGHVARYGGDEFVTLITKTSQEEAEEYIKNVTDSLAASSEREIKPSISLGYALKQHGGESLNALINIADQKMYEEKVRRKEKERMMLNG